MKSSKRAKSIDLEYRRRKKWEQKNKEKQKNKDNLDKKAEDWF